MQKIDLDEFKNLSNEQTEKKIEEFLNYLGNEIKKSIIKPLEKREYIDFTKYHTKQDNGEYVAKVRLEQKGLQNSITEYTLFLEKEAGDILIGSFSLYMKDSTLKLITKLPDNEMVRFVLRIYPSSDIVEYVNLLMRFQFDITTNVKIKFTD